MINRYAGDVYSILIKNGELAVAESFTGGAVCAELVKIAGMSGLLKNGFVCYSNESKIKNLGVPYEIIEKYGAVSEQTAAKMLDGLIGLGYDFAIATTGNAGPGAEKEGEVGLCFIGVSTKEEKKVWKFHFDGDRETVINSGVKAALECASKFFSEKVKRI